MGVNFQQKNKNEPIKKKKKTSRQYEQNVLWQNKNQLFYVKSLEKEK